MRSFPQQSLHQPPPPLPPSVAPTAPGKGIYPEPEARGDVRGGGGGGVEAIAVLPSALAPGPPSRRRPPRGNSQWPVEGPWWRQRRRCCPGHRHREEQEPAEVGAHAGCAGGDHGGPIRVCVLSVQRGCRVVNFIKTLAFSRPRALPRGAEDVRVAGGLVAIEASGPLH